MSRAFVVQLNDDCEPSLAFAGRVEHVRSGESIRFENIEEFRAFLSRILREERPDPYEHACRTRPAK